MKLLLMSNEARLTRPVNRPAGSEVNSIESRFSVASLESPEKRPAGTLVNGLPVNVIVVSEGYAENVVSARLVRA